MQRLVNIVAWSIGTLVVSSVVAAELFVGATFAIAVTEVDDRWLKVAFWAFAALPVAVSIAAVMLAVRGVLPGTRRTA